MGVGAPGAGDGATDAPPEPFGEAPADDPTPAAEPAKRGSPAASFSVQYDPELPEEEAPPLLKGRPVEGSTRLGSAVVSVVALAVDAARAALGVANSPTFAALNWPTGLEAPTLSIPTLAATAPLAAVTMIAAAPATVSARCLFM